MTLSSHAFWLKSHGSSLDSFTAVRGIFITLTLLALLVYPAMTEPAKAKAPVRVKWRPLEANKMHEGNSLLSLVISSYPRDWLIQAAGATLRHLCCWLAASSWRLVWYLSTRHSSEVPRESIPATVDARPLLEKRLGTVFGVYVIHSP